MDRVCWYRLVGFLFIFDGSVVWKYLEIFVWFGKGDMGRFFDLIVYCKDFFVVLNWKESKYLLVVE